MCSCKEIIFYVFTSEGWISLISIDDFEDVGLCNSAGLAGVLVADLQYVSPGFKPTLHRSHSPHISGYLPKPAHGGRSSRPTQSGPIRPRPPILMYSSQGLRKVNTRLFLSLYKHTSDRLVLHSLTDFVFGHDVELMMTVKLMTGLSEAMSSNV